jgi:hypothetical protein
VNSINGMSEILWWIAIVTLSVFVVAIGFYDGIATAISTWFILMLVLLILRPE